MKADDDSRRYFKKQEQIAEDVRRWDSSPGLSSPCLLGRTTTISTYPTIVLSYFACIPQLLLGTEQEGSTGVITSGSSNYFALNLGSTVPPAGTLVLTTFTGNRWVFRYDA